MRRQVSHVRFQLQTTESHLINYNPNALVDCEGKVVETEVRLLEATPEETGARGAHLVFEGNFPARFGFELKLKLLEVQLRSTSSSKRPFLGCVIPHRD